MQRPDRQKNQPADTTRSARSARNKLCIIDLQVGSDTIFFGLGNLGLKIVAMSYEMSLCFGSTQPEPATDVRRRDCASKHA